MPVVDAANAGGGVQDWYQSLPPVTRFMATTCFLTTLGVYAKLLNPRMLALVGTWIWQKYEVGNRHVALQQVSGMLGLVALLEALRSQGRQLLEGPAVCAAYDMVAKNTSSSCRQFTTWL
jgi:hypothetical protein